MTAYNPEYKCIFVNIPRTASGSIAEIVATGGHRTLLERKEMMEGRGQKKLYKEAFKFTIVRNPYDRFISGYYHLSLNEKMGDINKVLERSGILMRLTKPFFKKREVNENYYAIFRPQTDYIYDGNALLVDFIGKYERLSADWKIISKKIKVNQKLSRRNRSEHEGVKLTDKSKSVLNEYYYDDFKKLKYQMK